MDGYKYAKKKKLTGWKKGAAIVGGALLGAVNPVKILKYGKKGAQALYKASKYTKTKRSAYKSTKSVKKNVAKPKPTVVNKKVVKKVSKPAPIKKKTQTVKTQQKSVSGNIGCFVAGTKIHTDKGFKAIEHIKPGDYVWSENPETHEKALKKVKKIFVREKDSLVRLAINGEVIKTTNEHPFYVEGVGFVEAKKLKAGDEVRLEDGSTAKVETVEFLKSDKPTKVYNFEVEDFHTYYVSEQKVLVHNTCAVTQKNTITLKNSTNLLSNDNVMPKTYKSGKDGEMALAQLVGGKSQVYFSTSMGKRFVDQFANGIAHESKVGYTSLTQRIKKQILKDSELIATGKIKGAHWHFFTSEITGKGGPSMPLRNFLTEHGIDYTIH